MTQLSFIREDNLILKIVQKVESGLNSSSQKFLAEADRNLLLGAISDGTKTSETKHSSGLNCQG